MISPIQIYEGKQQPCEENFRSIQNEERMKPRGGLWTCDYLDAPQYSAWIQWCVENSFRGPDFKMWLLKPQSLDHLLVIDDLSAWNTLPINEKANYSPDYQYIDYEKLAERYDGIHLTENFLCRHRLDWSDTTKFSMTIYSWDVPSTLWFRWCFSSVEPLGEITINDPL
jgi:hypothetical protein